MMEGAARHHVVLGVDLDEAEIRAGFQDRPEMFGLEADASPWRQGPCRCRIAPARRGGKRQDAHGRLRARYVDQAFFSLYSMSWPLPVGEVFEAVFSQLPLGTIDQALP